MSATMQLSGRASTVQGHRHQGCRVPLVPVLRCRAPWVCAAVVQERSSVVKQAPAANSTPQPELPSGVQLPEEIEARIADYMDALRCYRAMQRQLGPVAAQLARSLAPASADPGTLTGLAGATTESKLAAYATAATTAGCSPEELAELVALRKRLLYELPRMRAAVAGMGERGMQQGRPAAGSDGAAGAEAAAAPKSTPTNCNAPVDQPAVGAVSQWVRARKYKQRSHSSAAEPAAAGAATASISPQVSVSEQLASSSVSGEASGAGAGAGTGPQSHLPSPLSAPTSLSSSLSSSTLGAAGAPGWGVLTNTVPVRAAVAAAASQGAPLAPVVMVPGVPGMQLPSALPSLRSQAAEGQGAGSAASGRPAGGAAGQAEESLSGPPPKLRNALLAAAQYKAKKSTGGSGTSSAAAGSSEAGAAATAPAVVQGADAAAPASAGGAPAPEAKNVERAQFDVYAAPRKSRANPDEAALLVCP